MPTVTGTLENIITKPELGKVEVQLCGYGSQVPRQNGTALFARLAVDEDDIPITATGTFSFSVPGNDQIVPAGTFYAVTVRNANGDVAQVNAYRFLSSTSTYDLNLTDPYDPNQPPPPLPPLITNQLLLMNWAADMQFPGDQYLSFRVTITGDVTSSELNNYEPGNLYTWIIQQDAVGGHSFKWPVNSYNMPVIFPTPNAVTVVTAVMGQSFLWPIGPATWYQL